MPAINMRRAPVAALLFSLSSASFAQNCDVLDTGEARPADFPSLQIECGGPGVNIDRGSIGSGQLTTIFAADNGFAGNTFDLENTGTTPIVIQSFEVNLEDLPPLGDANTIDVYFKEGSAVGFEADAAAWTLLGSDTNVVSQGLNVPTPVDVGGLVIQPGEVYGLYVDLASYVDTDFDCLHERRSGHVFERRSDPDVEHRSGKPTVRWCVFPAHLERHRDLQRS
jgi:hypothetical protein